MIQFTAIIYCAASTHSILCSFLYNIFTESRNDLCQRSLFPSQFVEAVHDCEITYEPFCYLYYSKQSSESWRVRVDTGSSIKKANMYLPFLHFQSIYVQT